MNLKAALIELQCEMVAERSLVNPKGISWTQYDILCQVKKEGEILPSKLNVILGISRTKLSKELKGLKSLGYVRQEPNQLDGRELFTSITQEGEKLLHAIASKHLALYETALKKLTEDEQEEFARLARKLSLGLKEERLNHHG